MSEFYRKYKHIFEENEDVPYSKQVVKFNSHLYPSIDEAQTERQNYTTLVKRLNVSPMRVGNYYRTRQISPLREHQDQHFNSNVSRVDKSQDNPYSSNPFLINSESLLFRNMGKHIITESIDNHLKMSSLSAKLLHKAPNNNNNSPIINSFHKTPSQISNPIMIANRISTNPPISQKNTSESPIPVRIRTESPDLSEDKNLARYKINIVRRPQKSREATYATSLELPSFKIEYSKRDSSEPRSHKRTETPKHKDDHNSKTTKGSIQRSISSFVGRTMEIPAPRIQHHLIKIFPKRKPSFISEHMTQKIHRFPVELYESLKQKSVTMKRFSGRNEGVPGLENYVTFSKVLAAKEIRRSQNWNSSQSLKDALNRRIDATLNNDRKVKLRAILEKERI